MLSHVADLTKRTAYSVDYRLCPEYSQPAAIEDCVSVYKGLLDMDIMERTLSFLENPQRNTGNISMFISKKI